METININFIAIIVAVVANFIFGFVWYTPLFGKAWAKEMGFDPNEKPKSSEMTKGVVFMLIGNFFLAWVLAHNIAAWDHVPSDMTANANAISAAIFTWLGFFFPVDLGSVAWEKKSWKLFGINTSYHFLSLLVVAMILVHMN